IYKFRLGQAHKGLKNYKKAIQYYENYLEEKPKDIASIYNISYCYYSIEDYPKALKYAELGENISDDDVDFQWLLGVVNQDLENYEKAIQYYKNYLVKNINDEEVKTDIKTCQNLLIKTQQESTINSSNILDAGKTKILQKKFVNYHSRLKDNKSFYPILRIPNFNCIIRTHKYGATKPSGYKDKSFENSIKHLFFNKYEVSSNVKLETGISTRSYEPDIAIICSTNKNIRIDIEIDEPYAGKTRQPTHCLGEDTNRDNYFIDRGWLVIRFTEYQVHTQEKECLKFIANVVNSIDNSFDIPSDFELIKNVKNEDLWNTIQAQKWEKERYRETYLNHTFVIDNNQKDFFKNETNEFSAQDAEEEKLVKSKSLGKQDKGKNIGFNSKNKHIRDERIKFYSESHTYTIDGVPAQSVSTVVSKFFPEFDAISKAYNLSPRNPLFGLSVSEIVKTWKDRGIEAANKGTFLHEQIENYYLQQPYEVTDEFYQFLNFVNEHNDIKPYRSEWRIFDETHNIAGTIDLLVENDNGSYDIYDWKRSKKVVNPYNGQVIKEDSWGNTGIGILEHIDDTSYNRYELQQNLYRHILEEKYGIEINNMYLIVMHTDEGYTNYHKVSLPHISNEINSILKTI
ncbi:tetratricopeptide repeat protein, partial [Flavobacteriaceae bacterium]|nr:tetratricopeptide repeat protein [Flavobacteriaceae bacterium]